MREPVSGLCFVGYADELSKSYAVLLAEQLYVHLARHGVDLREVELQTDNGTEFLEDVHQRGLPSTVLAWSSWHHYIPPKAYSWQSHVETVHWLVEEEFFDRETFGSLQQFWAKITIYWWYFDLARPNRGKDRLGPVQILRMREPNLDPAIAAWCSIWPMCAAAPIYRSQQGAPSTQLYLNYQTNGNRVGLGRVIFLCVKTR